MAGRANEVIARFGGQSALARALGVNQSTVQHWSKTGQIPSWREEQIARAAASSGHAPVKLPAPMVHGRADTVIYQEKEVGLPDKEVAALRSEIRQLRAMVQQLVGAVEALKEAKPQKAPRKAASKRARS